TVAAVGPPHSSRKVFGNCVSVPGTGYPSRAVSDETNAVRVAEISWIVELVHFFFDISIRNLCASARLQESSGSKLVVTADSSSRFAATNELLPFLKRQMPIANCVWALCGLRP